MTALNDFMGYGAPEKQARMLSGDRWVSRVMQRIGGISLMIASFGFWLQPGALWDVEVVLFKMGVSLVLGFIAIALIQNGRALPAAKVVIDIVGREIRLVRSVGGVHTLHSVISRTPLAEIGRAEQSNKMIRLWTKNDDLIAEVALTNPELRRSLIAALKDAGKL